MNKINIENFFSRLLKKEFLPIKLRIKISEFNQIESIKSNISFFLKKNSDFCNIENDSIDIKIEKTLSENKINFAEKIIQILNQNQSDLKLIYLIQDHELKGSLIKALYENLENQRLNNQNYILIFLSFDNLEDSLWLKNFFINLDFSNMAKKNVSDQKISNNEAYYLIEKTLIIESIFKASKKAMNSNQKKIFLEKINKIEKIFYKTENFNLNTNYVLDYIKILLKNSY